MQERAPWGGLVKVEKTIYKTIEGSETNEVQEIVKIIQYKYDNLDRRIQKVFNNGSYTNYYYLNKDIILEENYTKNDKIKTSKYFINGNQIDDVLAMEKVDHKTRKVTEQYTNKKGQIKTRNITENYTETNTYYYHKNHLNSIVAITDEFGNIVEEYEYDVFGKPYSKDILTGKVTNLKTSAIGNTRLFTGREYERGLQLYYNRARYYNPELGRFISRDPIDISDDVNLYSYVGNSPVSFVDPLGLAKQFGINFVREYDEFLKLEKQLEYLNIKFEKEYYRSWDFDYLKKLRKERDDVNNQFKAQEDLVRKMHYSRNKYNVDTPNNLNDLDIDEWKELKNSKSIYHSYENGFMDYNYKYISDDGHSEVVYDYNTGFKILDEVNFGTYNIYNPVLDADLHEKYDVNPYFLWGNGINDTTTKTDRYLKTLDYFPARLSDFIN